MSGGSTHATEGRGAGGGSLPSRSLLPPGSAAWARHSTTWSRLWQARRRSSATVPQSALALGPRTLRPLTDARSVVCFMGMLGGPWGQSGPRGRLDGRPGFGGGPGPNESASRLSGRSPIPSPQSAGAASGPAPSRDCRLGWAPVGGALWGRGASKFGLGIGVGVGVGIGVGVTELVQIGLFTVMIPGWPQNCSSKQQATSNKQQAAPNPMNMIIILEPCVWPGPHSRCIASVEPSISRRFRLCRGQKPTGMDRNGQTLAELTRGRASEGPK